MLRISNYPCYSCMNFILQLKLILLYRNSRLSLVTITNKTHIKYFEGYEC